MSHDKSNGAENSQVSSSKIKLPDWSRALATNDKGIPTKDQGNSALILVKSKVWQDCLYYDVVSDSIKLNGLPPLPNLPDNWDSLPIPKSKTLTEEHVAYIGLWLRRMWGQSWSDSAVRNSIVYAAKQHPIDSLASYLLECAYKWDHVNRLDTWLCDYLGAPRLPINLRIGPMWMISAVARAIRPGCKVDHILVLEGEQGVGKNRALEILFGDDYFLSSLPDLRDKDAMLLLAGSWCVCIDELSAIRTTDVERVKSFLTRRIDVYRPPYARDTVNRNRRCVFSGTTNGFEYLTDVSGNRRNWPVTCFKIDHEALKKDRDLLWGEAMCRYVDEEKWWPTLEESSSLKDIQSQREYVDEWADTIRRYVTGRDWVTIGELLHDVGIDKKDWKLPEQHRVGRVLRQLGWKSIHTRLPKDGKPYRYWIPTS